MKNNADEKIIIALVAPSTRQLGGQSIQAQSLVNAFASDREIEFDFIPNNPAAFGHNVKYFRTVSTSLKFWSSLLRRIKQADLVHVFSSGTTSYLISTLPPLVAAKMFGVKIILHYHTGEAEEHLRDWKLTAAPTMRKFDEIIVPSQFLVNVFGEFGLPARAIYNFVETEKFKFRPRENLRPIFLSNRNFEAHYQVSDILQAFRLIQEKYAEASLIVAGCGSEETKLKNLTGELKLENVEFVGRVEPNEMPKLYDRADIYLNASVVDNMPLSIIEAYSCGLPVVTTDAGGISFILENEKTGLMVAKSDYRELANAAIRLLENQDLAQTITNNALEYCQNFTREKVRAEWRNLYVNLLEQV